MTFVRDCHSNQTPTIMQDTWPTKCCCGESLSSIRGIQFNFVALYEVQEPLYECKKIPGAFYRNRKYAVHHFRRRQENDKWPSVMRLFPPDVNMDSCAPLDYAKRKTNEFDILICWDKRNEFQRKKGQELDV